MWENWFQLVCQLLGIPSSNNRRDAFQRWSLQESGSNVMRWNNPLNSTEDMPGSLILNDVGVRYYRTIEDGARATAWVLLQPPPEDYPHILSHLRADDPLKYWGDAAPDFDKWGTGNGWQGFVDRPQPTPSRRIDMNAVLVTSPADPNDARLFWIGADGILRKAWTDAPDTSMAFVGGATASQQPYEGTFTWPAAVDARWRDAGAIDVLVTDPKGVHWAVIAEPSGKMVRPFALLPNVSVLQPSLTISADQIGAVVQKYLTDSVVHDEITAAVVKWFQTAEAANAAPAPAEAPPQP